MLVLVNKSKNSILKYVSSLSLSLIAISESAVALSM